MHEANGMHETPHARAAWCAWEWSPRPPAGGAAAAAAAGQVVAHVIEFYATCERLKKEMSTTAQLLVGGERQSGASIRSQNGRKINANSSARSKFHLSYSYCRRVSG